MVLGEYLLNFLRISYDIISKDLNISESSQVIILKYFDCEMIIRRPYGYLEGDCKMPIRWSYDDHLIIIR